MDATRWEDAAVDPEPLADDETADAVEVPELVEPIDAVAVPRRTEADDADWIDQQLEVPLDDEYER